MDTYGVNDRQRIQRTKYKHGGSCGDALKNSLPEYIVLPSANHCPLSYDDTGHSPGVLLDLPRLQFNVGFKATELTPVGEA
jgi:hypothetical protein